MDKLIK